MPNWCFNYVTIISDYPDILVKFTKDESVFEDVRMYIDSHPSYEIDEDGKCATTCFETAWAPPIESLLLASHKYPQLTFDIEYEEPCMDFKGAAIISEGTVLKDLQWSICDKRIEEEFELINRIVKELVCYTLRMYDYEHVRDTFTDFIESNDLHDLGRWRKIEYKLPNTDPFSIQNMVDIICHMCENETILAEYPDAFLTQILVNYQTYMEKYISININLRMRNCLKKIAIKSKLCQEIIEFSLSPPIEDYPLLVNGGSSYRECLNDWKCMLQT